MGIGQGHSVVGVMPEDGSVVELGFDESRIEGGSVLVLVAGVVVNYLGGVGFEDNDKGYAPRSGIGVSAGGDPG